MGAGPIFRERDKRGIVIAMLEGAFLLLAVGVGLLVACYGVRVALPILVGLLGFLALRYVIRRPFPEALSFFLMAAAFNYYYFYCAKLTGRNPTDFGTWGTPATVWEKLQKDIAFFGLLAIAAVQWLRCRLENRAQWHAVWSHPLLLFTVGWLGFTLARGVLAAVQNEALFHVLYALRSNLEFAIIPLLMATSLVSDAAALARIGKGLWYPLPVVAGLGIIEFCVHGSPYVRSFGGGHLFYRAASTLQNPNNLGGYLALTLGVLLVYFLAKQLTRWERRLFWPTVVLGVTCLLMTLSRSSMVFCGLSLLITGALSGWARRKQTAPKNQRPVSPVALVGGLGAVAAIGFLLQYFDFQQALGMAIDQYVRPSSEQAGFRLYAPWMMLDHLLENPVSLLLGQTWAAVPTNPDNAFAIVLLRNGLLGFGCYLALWLAALTTSVRQALKPGANFLYWVCLYGFCFQGLYALSAPINENFPHNLYFWVLVGMLACLERERTRDDHLKDGVSHQKTVSDNA